MNLSDAFLIADVSKDSGSNAVHTGEFLALCGADESVISSALTAVFFFNA